MMLKMTMTTMMMTASTPEFPGEDQGVAPIYPISEPPVDTEPGMELRLQEDLSLQGHETQLLMGSHRQRDPGRHRGVQ
jgi:hypothetical protein